MGNLPDTLSVRATMHLRNNRLLAVREQRKLTQVAAAAACGVSHSFYMELEKLDFRRVRESSMGRVAKVAIFFGLSTEDIVPASLVGTAVNAKVVKVQEISALALRALAGDTDNRLRLPAPDEVAESHERLEALTAAIQDLPDRERCILEMRYGLDGRVVSTLSEVGAAIGLTKERVRQLEYRAIRQLEAPLAQLMPLTSKEAVARRILLQTGKPAVFDKDEPWRVTFSGDAVPVINERLAHLIKRRVYTTYDCVDREAGLSYRYYFAATVLGVIGDEIRMQVKSKDPQFNRPRVVLVSELLQHRNGSIWFADDGRPCSLDCGYRYSVSHVGLPELEEPVEEESKTDS